MAAFRLTSSVVLMSMAQTSVDKAAGCGAATAYWCGHGVDEDDVASTRELLVDKGMAPSLRYDVVVGAVCSLRRRPGWTALFMVLPLI